MLRLVILISGSGTNLQAIMDACNSSIINAKVVGVISNNPNAYGLTRAKNSQIPTLVINNNLYSTREEFDNKLLSEINNFMPDLVVLAGFMRILSTVMTRPLNKMMVNIHPSLLPKYPGMNTHKQVIKNNDREHGVTIHLVSEELDAGPIIAQAKILVNSDESIEDLIARIHKVEHILFPEIIGMIASQDIKLTNTIEKKDIVYRNYEI
jgi:phosphoribosylglycinamide formyltransferase-1